VRNPVNEKTRCFIPAKVEAPRSQKPFNQGFRHVSTQEDTSPSFPEQRGDFQQQRKGKEAAETKSGKQ